MQQRRRRLEKQKSKVTVNYIVRSHGCTSESRIDRSARGSPYARVRAVPARYGDCLATETSLSPWNTISSKLAYAHRAADNKILNIIMITTGITMTAAPRRARRPQIINLMAERVFPARGLAARSRRSSPPGRRSRAVLAAEYVPMTENPSRLCNKSGLAVISRARDRKARALSGPSSDDDQSSSSAGTVLLFSSPRARIIGG